jgi:hypothetical protein
MPGSSSPVATDNLIEINSPELDTCTTPQALGSTAFPALRRVIVLSKPSYAGTLRWADVIAAGQAVSPAQRRARQHAVDPDATALIMYKQLLENLSRKGFVPIRGAPRRGI